MISFKKHLLQELAVKLDYKSLIQKLKLIKYNKVYVKKNFIEDQSINNYKTQINTNIFLRPENRSQEKIRLNIGHGDVNSEIMKKIEDIKNEPYPTFDEYSEENPENEHFGWDLKKRKDIYRKEINNMKYRRSLDIKERLKRLKTHKVSADYRKEQLSTLKDYYDIKKTKKTIKKLDKILKKAKHLDPVILYRVVGYDGTGYGKTFGNYKDDFDRRIKQAIDKKSVSTFVDFAYMSCMYDKKRLKKSLTNTSVVLMILCPKPYKGIFPNIDDPEKEVILPRKSKFLINAINDEEEKKYLDIRHNDLVIMTLISQKV